MSTSNLFCRLQYPDQDHQKLLLTGAAITLQNLTTDFRQKQTLACSLSAAQLNVRAQLCLRIQKETLKHFIYHGCPAAYSLPFCPNRPMRCISENFSKTCSSCPTNAGSEGPSEGAFLRGGTVRGSSVASSLCFHGVHPFFGCCVLAERSGST